jgi:hypothetical protein
MAHVVLPKNSGSVQEADAAESGVLRREHLSGTRMSQGYYLPLETESNPLIHTAEMS